MANSIEQRIFNRVVNHLRKQGRPAMDDGNCLYRAPDGCTCAIGAIITDKNYKPSLEKKTIGQDVVQAAVRQSIRKPITEEIVRLLIRLQRAHDTPFNRDEAGKFDVAAIEANFLSIAAEFGLAYTAPKGVAA